MLEKLQNKKAEGYIDVAVAVLVIVFLLVFSVGIFSKIAVKQDLSHMCHELVRSQRQAAVSVLKCRHDTSSFARKRVSDLQ